MKNSTGVNEPQGVAQWLGGLVILLVVQQVGEVVAGDQRVRVRFACTAMLLRS